MKDLNFTLLWSTAFSAKSPSHDIDGHQKDKSSH